MDVLTTLATIALAGAIHASFQLSISTLTLMSGHALGAKASRIRLLKLVGGFSVGTVIMTLLLLSSAALWLQLAFGTTVPALAWATACGFLFGLSMAVWIFYYRKEPGTSLWVPRGIARYLMSRSKATRVTAEALSLGMTSVIGELLFIAGPIIATALLLIELEPFWQLVGVGVYALTSLLPFLFVASRISSGYSIAKIQHWRVDNKRFLQFIAGLGLIILAFCIYANEVSPGAAIVGRGF